jgi:predicted DNA-binding transcriptional regulator AlpA
MNSIVTEPDHQSASKLVYPEREAASMLGLSQRSLQRLRLEGGGPKFIKLTQQRIGYTPAALHAWIDSREVRSTAEAKVAYAKASARA